MAIIEHTYIHTYFFFCEVANFVSVFREMSWVTGGMAKIEWGSQGYGAESAHPPRHCTATGLTDLTNKLHRDDYVRRGRFTLAKIGN
jgi:hypothetical protein